ncbi:hypothetical protein C4577_03525 [Candidatus Parcubacteria bacterium]|nr:MAG: hypothetical protein C4577_03525 [Candidatus Parcubacteria bacterium]
MPYAPPTLSQAQTALSDALEPLTTGKINTPKQIWALETLQLFAIANIFSIPESGIVAAQATPESKVELTDEQMLVLLNQWNTSGNMYTTIAHPQNANLLAGINWAQLIKMILPLLLNEILKYLDTSK